MGLIRALLAAAAVGVILTAFRDPESGGWLLPGQSAAAPPDDTEPVLGYDGMDTETLIPWLSRAGLERDTLLRIRRYETAHLEREAVLATVEDLMEAW